MNEAAEVDSNVKTVLNKIPEFSAHLEIICKLGQGSFSTVALVADKNNTEIKFALKCLVPTTSPDKAAGELVVLRKLGGQENVINLLCTFRYEDRIFFMMDYFPHDNFTEFVVEANFAEIRDYIKHLLIALKHVHKHGIIHRDVKATNFLFNRQLRKYRLIDFGLAENCPKYSGAIEKAKRKLDNDLSIMNNSNLENNSDSNTFNKRARISIGQAQQLHQLRYSKRLLGSTTNRLDSTAAVTFSPAVSVSGGAVKPIGSDSWAAKGASNTLPPVCACFGKPLLCKLCKGRKHEKVNKAGTAGFRAPEVLLNSGFQTTAIDVWSAGVMLLGLLSRRYPFMKPKDDETALAQLMTLFGSESVARLAHRLGKKFVCQPILKPINIRRMCKYLRCASKEELQSLADQDSLFAAAASSTNCLDCLNNFVSPCKLCLCIKTDHPVPPPAINCVSSETEDMFFDQAVELLLKMLNLNPQLRLTADQALQDEFFVNCRAAEST